MSDNLGTIGHKAATFVRGRTAQEGPARRALVLSGGGAKGAYQAGAVAALAAAGVRFDIVVGASVGTSNAAAYAMGLGRELPSMWVDSMATTRFFALENVGRGKNPFLLSEGMRRMAEKYFSVDKVLSSPVELVVAATDFETGLPVAWSNRDAGWSHDERLLQFLASSAIPGICSEVIRIRGRRNIDAGFSDIVPIHAAIARGADEIWVVDVAREAEPTRFQRALALAARVIAYMPVPGARLAANLLREVGDPKPLARRLEIEGALVRIGPSGPLPISTFDFAPTGIAEAAAIGRADAERLIAAHALAGRA